MDFRPLESRSVRWAPAAGEGLEHLTIEPTPRGPLIRSVLAGSFEGRAFGARYEIACDEGWRVLLLEISATDGRGLSLLSPEPGRWVERSGTPRPDLDGCIDVDLSATPFTNTLPIRRTGLASAEGERSFRMLYVPFDTFEPFPDTQFYTGIEDGRRCRFVNDDRSFDAELTLDEDGLVLDYPGLFRRLPETIS